MIFWMRNITLYLFIYFHNGFPIMKKGLGLCFGLAVLIWRSANLLQLFKKLMSEDSRHGYPQDKESTRGLQFMKQVL